MHQIICYMWYTSNKLYCRGSENSGIDLLFSIG
jgi:hypothetical protein